MSDQQLAAIAASMTPEGFDALRSILSDLGQRVQASEAVANEARASSVTVSQLQSVFQQALSSAQFTVNTPVPAQPSSTGRPNIKAELPLFRGKEEDDVRAWLTIIEDYLTGQRLPETDWPSQVSVLFRDDAMRWYVSQKKARGTGNPFTWKELREALEKKFDSPLRVESLRAALRTMKLKGSIADYCEAFRSLESQIPEADMTFPDRLTYFLSHLPADARRDIRREKPSNVEDMYYAAREYEREINLDSSTPILRSKRPGADAATVHNPTNTWFPSNPTQPEADHADSTTPMDLDVMLPGRRRRDGSQGGQPRCYNCNGTGHIARNCSSVKKSGRSPPAAARTSELNVHVAEKPARRAGVNNDSQDLYTMLATTDREIEELLSEGEGNN